MSGHTHRLVEESAPPVAVDSPYAARSDIIVRAHVGERTISIRRDCDGSPDCVAEIHIDSRGKESREVHLDLSEARELRRLLKVAIRSHRSLND